MHHASKFFGSTQERQSGVAGAYTQFQDFFGLDLHCHAETCEHMPVTVLRTIFYLVQ
jgi:hypothetical protein